MLMAKKICKSQPEWEEVGHYCIAQFAEHERAQELVDSGMAMKFISGMIYRNYWSKNSRYYYEHKQANRMVLNGWDKPENAYMDGLQYEEYDQHTDDTIEAILGVIEDMKAGGIEQWYKATLLEMWSETPNYSELSRKTKIPRTSIAQSVREAQEYIRQQLKNNNINYDPT
jgi:hypothetical protein